MRAFPIRALAILSLFSSAQAETRPRLSDTEQFRLEDRYETGTYLVMGGLLSGAIAAITHDRTVALGFYGGSLVMRFAGLPLLGLTAGDLCRANADAANCETTGWDYFILSLGAESVLAYQMVDLARDEFDHKPQNGVKVGAAIGAAGLSTLAYLYSWYKFRDLKQRSEPTEGRVSLEPAWGPGGRAGVLLTLRLGAP